MYKNLWSNIVRGLSPYVPGEQPKDKRYIKLNTNENPYGPSPMVIAALNRTAGDDLRLYPDPESLELRTAIAGYYGLVPDEVFVSNGSDEALALAFYSFFQQELPVMFPAVSYSFYPVYTRLFQIEAKMPALKSNFSINPADYKTPNGGIIIPNPNAPTSIGLPLAAIEEIVAANPKSVVAIDEAYVDFGCQSAVPLIPKYPNLLVIQTMSKSRSLAGMRVGYCLGNAGLIEALNRTKNSFNSYPLDRLAQAAGIAAMQDEAYFAKCCAKIIATRTKTVTDLEAMGFEVLPSQANFIFARHSNAPAADLFAKLKANGVLVRYFKQQGISDWLRITIGDDGEMGEFIKCVQGLL